MSLKPSGKTTLKLPKKFDAFESKATVAEVQTSNPVGDKSFLLRFLTQKVLQSVFPKRRSKLSWNTFNQIFIADVFFIVRSLNLFFRVWDFQPHLFQVLMVKCLLRSTISGRWTTSLEIPIWKAHLRWSMEAIRLVQSSNNLLIWMTIQI